MNLLNSGQYKSLNKPAIPVVVLALAVALFYILEQKERKTRHKFYEQSSETCILFTRKQYPPRNPSAYFRSPPLPATKKFNCSTCAVLSKRSSTLDFIFVLFLFGFLFVFYFHCSYLIGNKCMSNILTSIAPRRLALSPMLSSMYLLSSSVIVGCFAGLSYETKSQNIYQTIPKLPLERKEKL